MKKCIISLTLLSLFFLSPSPVSALKKRVVKKTAVSSSLAISVKLSKDHKNLNLFFSGLSSAQSVSYELTYLASGIEQGVYGSIDPKKSNSDSRSLYFGTCSKNACTAHKNITGTSLVITSKLKNQKTQIRRYKVKV